MDYQTRLLEVAQRFPFDKWRRYEMEQYTPENCGKAQSIIDTLLADLAALGEGAAEEAKMQKFQVAVEALNTLDAETGIIETGEREELCDLFWIIAEKASIDPSKYGGGEGPASEWRDW